MGQLLSPVFLTPDTIFNIRSSGDAVAKLHLKTTQIQRLDYSYSVKQIVIIWRRYILRQRRQKFNIDLYHSDVNTKLLKTSVADEMSILGYLMVMTLITQCLLWVTCRIIKLLLVCMNIQGLNHQQNPMASSLLRKLIETHKSLP